MRRLPWALVLAGAVANAQAVPTVETDAVPGVGAAGSAAIWVHPTDASQSLVVTGDGASGLITYGLDGHTVQTVPDGIILGVDVRYGILLGGAKVDLIAVANQTAVSIGFYAVSPTTRQLALVGSVFTSSVGMSPIGVALYAPPGGVLSAFAYDANGNVAQFALGDDGTGHVTGTVTRQLSLPGTAQSGLADDVQGTFFLALSSIGIVRFPAAADGGVVGLLIDSTDGGRLTPPIAGLALYQEASGGGYLIASNPGSRNYNVYSRTTGSFVTAFSLGADGGLESPQGTAGIAAMSFPLGPAFPQGLFVAQDAHNDVGTNFKYVPWNAISLAAGVGIDTSVNPRGGSAGTDGGGGTTPDSGNPGGGGGPGPGVGDAPPGGPSNCGCGAADAGAIAALLAVVGLAARRRARRLICGPKPR